MGRSCLYRLERADVRLKAVVWQTEKNETKKWNEIKHRENKKKNKKKTKKEQRA